MNKRALALGLGGLILIGLGAWWFLYTFERVSEDVRLPPKEEAAFNPLYALHATLEAHGERAQARRWFRVADWKPGARDTLVLYGAVPPFSAEESARVLAWVEGGGHLVLRTRSLLGAPAFAEGLGLALPAEDPACARVLAAGEATGAEKKAKAKSKGNGSVEADDADEANPEPVFGGGFVPSMPVLCGPVVAGDADLLGHEFEDEGGAPFARVPLGDGAVTLVNSLDFLRNTSLEVPVARELAYQVLAPGLGRGGAFTLVYGDDVPSLWGLIVRHGWAILIPAALALLAWLALRSQRLGTLRPLPPAHRRALLEHVQAAGEFAFRRGRAVALHRAVRDRFERRLVRRDPVLAALEGDARVVALAECCALPASRVSQALAPRELHKPDAFFQSISTLALMRLRI